MSWMFLFIICFICVSYIDAQHIQFNFDWSDFLEKQDLIWKFNASDENSMPAKWYDGPFAGNGNLGIMMFFEKYAGKYCLRINLGRADVWDHRMNDSQYAVHNNEYDRIRLDTGSYYLIPDGIILHGNMRINLYDAIITGNITTTNGTINFTSHVNSLNYIIIFDIITTGNEINNKFIYITRKTHLPRGDRSGYIYNPEAICGKINDIYYCQYNMLAGGDYCEAHKIIKNDNNYRIYITMDNSVTFNITRSKSAYDGAIELINKYVKANYNQLLDDHKLWWHTYYNKSFVSIPHKKTESFYWIQMYKLASATRCQPDNCWAYDLLDTYWSDYHFDLNIQLATWPLWTSNHEELFGSAVEFTKNNMQNFRLSVPPKYQNDSGAVGTETGWDWGIDGESWGSTNGYIQPPGSILGNLNWFAQYLWIHYKYTNNIQYLKEIVYPTLKMSTQYYYRLLIKKDDGKYHIPNALSPEYASCEDTNWDLGLYRWSVETMEKIINILNIKEPLLDIWLETIDNLVDYPKDNDIGLYIGKDTKLTSSHRHWSHLLMIYPLRLIDYKTTPELSDIITKSIEHWLSYKPTDYGYSIAIASIFKLIMPNNNNNNNNEEEAWNYFISSYNLNRISTTTMYWEINEVPTNESPLALAHVLQYMILRSDNGLVEVFPTNINELQNITIYNFKAEGGFLVSGVRINGETSWISFTSLFGNKLLFSCPDLLSIEHEPASVRIIPAKPGVYGVEINKNEYVFIYPTGKKPSSYSINMVIGKDSDYNSWGKH